jgi:putative ABC transport system ATP-binding protein
MSIITEDITKTYSETKVPVRALNEVSFKIAKSEFLAIVGPSGSGKTTMLNMLGGLDSPDTGRVIINDIDITTLKPSKLINFRLRHIGFVFQSFNLIPVLTAKENIEFIMLLQKIPPKERSTRAMELLEAVGLQDRADNRPGELSGGQQQRIAVARALVSQPDFILADEPTANLDSKTATNLLDLMASLNASYNTTFVFSTHDQRVIRRARRVVTLQDGEIISDVQQTSQI